MSAPGRPIGLGIRTMGRADLDSVLEIERAANAFPWSRDIFADCLRVGHACSVLEHDGAVEGFGILEIRGVESRVLNLCVRPRAQGRGLGRALLTAIIDAARRRGADTLTLEVRTTNEVARRLYASAGFHEVGVRPGYYPARRGREDALVLARTLAAPAPLPESARLRPARLTG